MTVLEMMERSGMDNTTLTIAWIKDAIHLINALKEAYNITVDYQGTEYCGLQLKWNYSKGYVDVTMPSFAFKTLDKLNLMINSNSEKINQSELLDIRLKFNNFYNSL